MELKNYLGLVAGATAADILSTSINIGKTYGDVIGVEGNPFVAGYINNGDPTGYAISTAIMAVSLGLCYVADKYTEKILKNKNPEDKTKLDNFVEKNKLLFTKFGCIGHIIGHSIGALSWYYPIGYPLSELSELLYSLI